MNKSILRPKGNWASLTLTVAISTVCLGIACDSDMLKSDRKPTNKETVLNENSLKLQLMVSIVTSNLSELTVAMERLTPLLSRDHVPNFFFENDLFDLIAQNLRLAERALRNDKDSAVYVAEYKVLARSIAKARSVASLNSSIISQSKNVADTYESDIDMQGLKSLVAYSTDRLISSIS
ncbi:MAG: hypothetical protein ABIO21_27610 [Pseudomonas sp.]